MLTEGASDCGRMADHADCGRGDPGTAVPVLCHATAVDSSGPATTVAW